MNKSEREQAVQELRPQAGPQEAFLKSAVDCAVYGGSAGSGKSFALLLEQIYHTDNGGYRGVIFRRTQPMLRQPGGLWDTSFSIYPLLGAVPNQSALEWRFRSGAVVKLAAMELENDRYNWQGSQVAGLSFDELAEFTESQFWFLMSRNRSMSGVKPFVRCSTNPVPDTWLREFLRWWIDDTSGYPIPERAGKVRWLIRVNDEICWGDSREELIERYGPDFLPRSVAFYPASVHDNRILLEKDPAYLSTLKSLPHVERLRLLGGNWNVRSSAGNFFRREWFGEPIDRPPTDIVMKCRFWDRAASELRSGTDPDATCGVLLGKDSKGVYYVLDCVKIFATAHNVEKEMRRCAARDGVTTIVAFAQDPGSAGKGEAEAAARALDGFHVRFNPATGDKESRARPTSAQAEAGNIKLIRAPWNNGFIQILENFPEGRHDDEVDALSGAHEILRGKSGNRGFERIQLYEPHFNFNDYQKLSRRELDVI
jgi:predicted phage terminase large subunit-like protein